MVKVSTDKCLACGGCVNTCPFDCLRLTEARIRVKDCRQCDICVPVCPGSAIVSEKK